jgi:subtilisin family serine protease
MASITRRAYLPRSALLPRRSSTRCGIPAIRRSIVSLYAPGVGVYSSIPTNAFEFASGTSQAAAQVAGDIALMEEEMGHSYSVTRILTILRKTGKPITARGYTIPRIDIGAAYDVIFIDGFNG